MPNIHGLDLIKQIRDYDTNAYIVMVTSDSKKENVIDSIKNQASGSIAKPFDKEVFSKISIAVRQ